LSVTISGYTLDDNHNLYHLVQRTRPLNSFGGVQVPVLVDTGVEKFAVANARVIDLHTDGKLVAADRTSWGTTLWGTTLTNLSTDVTDFAVNRQTGAVFALRPDGRVWVSPAGRPDDWQTSTSPGMKAVAVAPDGAAYVLDAARGILSRSPS